MSIIDTRPQIVDIYHYAGDTLTIQVVVSDGMSTGMTWRAQVRTSRDITSPDASFTISPTADGAVLTMPASETTRLAQEGGVLLTGLELRNAVAITPTALPPGTVTMLRYSGEWDVQISAPGGDPVTTLAQGKFTLDMDVSRAVG